MEILARQYKDRKSLESAVRDIARVHPDAVVVGTEDELREKNLSPRCRIFGVPCRLPERKDA